MVNEAQVDVFLEFSSFFYNPADVGNLISGSSAFSKSSLNIWEFTVHVPLKPGLENFEHYFASVWNECNGVIVWTFFSIAFLWDWNENWPFPVLWPWLSFLNLLAYWVQYFDNSNNLSTWCKELTHWERLWCLERLKAGGEGDGTEWDNWMVSLTWWTWVWANSKSWWWAGKPAVLQSKGLQRVGQDWTELNWKWIHGCLSLDQQLFCPLELRGHESWSLAYKKWGTKRTPCLGVHRTLLSFILSNVS